MTSSCIQVASLFHEKEQVFLKSVTPSVIPFLWELHTRVQLVGLGHIKAPEKHVSLSSKLNICDWRWKKIKIKPLTLQNSGCNFEIWFTVVFLWQQKHIFQQLSLDSWSWLEHGNTLNIIFPTKKNTHFKTSGKSQSVLIHTASDTAAWSVAIRFWRTRNPLASIWDSESFQLTPV